MSDKKAPVQCFAAINETRIFLADKPRINREYTAKNRLSTAGQSRVLFPRSVYIRFRLFVSPMSSYLSFVIGNGFLMTKYLLKKKSYRRRRSSRSSEVAEQVIVVVVVVVVVSPAGRCFLSQRGERGACRGASRRSAARSASLRAGRALSLRPAALPLRRAQSVLELRRGAALGSCRAAGRALSLSEVETLLALTRYSIFETPE